MGNNCNIGCCDNNNSWIWILLALVFFCNGGIGGIGGIGGLGNFGGNNCGCDRDDNNWIWIILLIVFFCCNNNRDHCC